MERVQYCGLCLYFAKSDYKPWGKCTKKEREFPSSPVLRLVRVRESACSSFIEVEEEARVLNKLQARGW